MATATDRTDETEALAALHALDMLDSDPEAEFDALALAAAAVCGVPISLISLLDRDRQWFKTRTGLDGVPETPREAAFCAHAVLGDELFEVEDALLDPRFADNPLVTGQPGIRFYAGAPLTLDNGLRIGTLCVIDRVSRRLTPMQRDVLKQLSIAAVKAMEGRLAVRRVREAALDDKKMAIVLANTTDAVVGLTPAGRISRWNLAAESIFGYPVKDVLGQPVSLLHPPEQRGPLEMRLAHVLAGGRELRCETTHLRSDGAILDVELTYVPEYDAAGRVIQITKFLRDVTDAKRAARRIEASERNLRLVVNSVPSILAYWNTDLTCQFANPPYLTWFGVDPATLPGQHIRQVIGDALYARNKPLIDAVLRGEPQTFERSLPGADGALRHSLTHYAPDIVNHQVRGFLVQITDITQQKNTEIALRTSQDFLERSGLIAGVGGWEFDLRSEQVLWSAQTCRIHGMAAGYRPTVQEALAFYRPHHRPVIEAAVQKALADGSDFDLELELERHDGSFHWVRAFGTAERIDGRVVRLFGAFQDIDERHRLALQLAEKHELLQVTLQSIGDAVITTDEAACVTWLNPVAERMTGWLATEAVGRPVAQVFHIVNEDTRALSENPVAICLKQGKTAGLARHTLLISRDGREFGIEDSAAPIRNAEGQLLGVVLVFHDVSEQRRLTGEMTYRATHDTLTGLANRAEFEARLLRLLRKAHEEQSEHALLFVDLDQFKLVNDACGHAVGDLLLQQVAKLLGKAVRNRDTLARLGGDEFGIILEHCTVEQAGIVGQKICDQMDDFRFLHEDHRFRIGASIGLVPVDRRWASTAAIQQAADSACYAAKEAGRNRMHTWFDTDAAIRARRFETQWASRIESALDAHGFTLFAQRIAPLRPDARAGLHAEVLVRMKGEDGALVLPGAFLPAAERFNLVSRLDRWVLRQVIAWLRRQPTLDPIEMLCVNLSGQSVGDRAFHAWASKVLEEAGQPIRSRLCLEITETVAVTNMADAAIFINLLRSTGVRVALDDFGAGASSFGYLKSLQVDFLKIDGQFIRDLVTDPLDDAAVRCFIDVARLVGVQTVAEFVENPAILARLHELGIDFAQGYLIHAPEVLDQLGELRIPA